MNWFDQENLFYEIASRLDIISLSNLLSTTKYLWKIREHSSFAKLMTYQDVARKKQWTRALNKAIQCEDMEHIRLFIRKGASVNYGLITAVQIGKLEVIQLLLQNNADVNIGMREAAKNGNRELFDYFIEAGADDWDLGLIGASSGGHLDLVDMLLKKPELDGYVDEDAVFAAAEAGHVDLLEKYDNMLNVNDLAYGIVAACKGRHLDAVDFFLDKGLMEWNRTMYAEGYEGAVLGGDDYLMNFFNHGFRSWERNMELAACVGNKKLVENCVYHGACNWNRGLSMAAHSGNWELVEYFIEKGGSDWNDAMCKAAWIGHKDLVQFFIDKGATDLKSGLLEALDAKNDEMITFFTDRTDQETLEEAKKAPNKRNMLLMGPSSRVLTHVKWIPLLPWNSSRS